MGSTSTSAYSVSCSWYSASVDVNLSSKIPFSSNFSSASSKSIWSTILVHWSSSAISDNSSSNDCRVSWTVSSNLAKFEETVQDTRQSFEEELSEIAEDDQCTKIVDQIDFDDADEKLEENGILEDRLTSTEAEYQEQETEYAEVDVDPIKMEVDMMKLFQQKN